MKRQAARPAACMGRPRMHEVERRGTTLQVRLNVEQSARLQAWADAHQMSRSNAVRAWIDSLLRLAPDADETV